MCLVYGTWVVLKVIMIGRWSDACFFSVVQKVFIASEGEQKVMSGDDLSRCAWWGICVC